MNQKKLENFLAIKYEIANHSKIINWYKDEIDNIETLLEEKIRSLKVEAEEKIDSLKLKIKKTEDQYETKKQEALSLSDDLFDLNNIESLEIQKTEVTEDVKIEVVQDVLEEPKKVDNSVIEITEKNPDLALEEEKVEQEVPAAEPIQDSEVTLESIPTPKSFRIPSTLKIKTVWTIVPVVVEEEQRNESQTVSEFLWSTEVTTVLEEMAATVSKEEKYFW